MSVLFEVESLPEKETPLMRQYNQIKAQHPHALLLFRIGDFYETFGEDAVKTAEILGIVLTRRANGAAAFVELAGFPHHSLNTYLPKLIRAGQRVAICDQLEDPKLAKGIVKRGVTEIVTPGIAFTDQILDHARNNYLAALHFPGPDTAGLAFVDVSTGDFFCLTTTRLQAEKLLFSLRPAEVLLPRADYAAFADAFGQEFHPFRLEDWVFQGVYGTELLLRHFQVANLKGFGLEDEPHGTAAAGALLHYLAQNEQHELRHLNRIYRWQEQHFLSLDRFTLRNLELLQPLHPDGRALADVLDATQTPMGQRALRRWISFPLLDVEEIDRRLQCVEHLTQHPELAEALRTALGRIADIERLLARLATRRILPRELHTLRNTLLALGPLYEPLGQTPASPFATGLAALPAYQPALELAQHYLHPEPAALLGKGPVARPGLNPELDELRELKQDVEAVLEKMRQREIIRTGISSLKVAYNKVFGYYIEISNANRDRVPPDYIRKQTLTGAERYITPELKEFEEKILHAEEKILALENRLFAECIERLLPHIPALQAHATWVAQLDVLLGFARLATQRAYTRPRFTPEPLLHIRAGRHPVIERLLPPDAPYVPNDVRLHCHDEQVLIITGPNMAGKSALLRQVALIQLMAQMGSFVPADEAVLCVADRIFTRVGASDNISAGESTFMVEMNEAARILNTATPRSLVLLDEVGRGTSTFDGVSIAWAITEHLHNAVGARTMFATHYHELAALADHLPRVRNYHVSVREAGGRVLFLRKLEPGHTAHSFGIQVAQMAGLPRSVVQRAQELLAHFEAQSAATHFASAAPPTPAPTALAVHDATWVHIRNSLLGTDVNRLTPVEALLKLQELKQLAEQNPE